MIIIQVQGVLLYEVLCSSGIYTFLNRHTLLGLLSGCATKHHQKTYKMLVTNVLNGWNHYHGDDTEKNCAVDMLLPAFWKDSLVVVSH